MEITESTEANLREAAIASWRRRSKDIDGIRVDEFRFFNGLCRADSAIFRNRSVVAFEVKSKSDSLKKLSNQIDIYNNHFDKVIICLDLCFRKRFDSSKYGERVEVLYFDKGKVIVERRGKTVPHDNVRSYAALLNSSELVGLIAKCHKITRREAESNFEDLIDKTPRSEFIRAIYCRAQNINKIRYFSKTLPNPLLDQEAV
ncbi:sce7726 family protein [Oceanicaulis sp.]|uniref:sce7726 family protein n=1 Tax=Oceanicaulis sp. TaxID=1924941 RepID=UPI003F715817